MDKCQRSREIPVDARMENISHCGSQMKPVLEGGWNETLEHGHGSSRQIAGDGDKAASSSLTVIRNLKASAMRG